MTLSIIHVEDDPDIREIAKMAFEFAGDYDVQQFEDSAACLAGLNGQVPDVFLLDVMMPGMDGVGLLGELRKSPDYANVPAIFMTARVQASEVQPLLDTGALGVIAKPFDPLELAPQVERLLEGAPK